MVGSIVVKWRPNRMNPAGQRSLQIATCQKYSTEPMFCDPEMRVGITPEVKEGVLPVLGTRLKPEGNWSGWLIYAGPEPTDDPDFYLSLCVKHIVDWSTVLIPYLALPPGSRFVLFGDENDHVWFEPDLLDYVPR